MPDNGRAMYRELLCVVDIRSRYRRDVFSGRLSYLPTRHSTNKCSPGLAEAFEYGNETGVA